MKKNFEIIARYTYMFDCPENSNFLNEGYEHIQCSSDKGYIYFHLCESCRLRFDTEEEEQLCPRCKKLSKNVGFEIREFEDNSFWGKIRKNLMKFLP